jgi:large subunit ribosomal protein L22
MATAHATSRYIRTSAQKAGLVLDQIRGRNIGEALATLQYSRKIVARDIEKALRSAIANVQQQDTFGGDVERLFVARCWADQGPSMKRIRPAPMGRAFRVVKRTAHLTVEVAERAKTAGRTARGVQAGKTPKTAKSAGKDSKTARAGKDAKTT